MAAASCICVYCDAAFWSDEYVKTGICPTCRANKAVYVMPKLREMLETAEKEARKEVMRK